MSALMETFVLEAKLPKGVGDVVQWHAPDDKVYQLDPKKAKPGKWLITRDAGRKPVMAFLKQPGKDGKLVLSLKGATSTVSTLLHEDDDTPRQLYFATDGGNHVQAVLPEWDKSRPAFILQEHGNEGCPVGRWARYRVLCLGA